MVLFHEWYLRDKSVSDFSLLNISVIGVLLIFLPSVSLSIFSRFQNLIKFGSGYIAVYISVFGVCLVLISIFGILLNGIQKRNSKKILIVFFLLANFLALISSVNYVGNQIAIDRLNIQFKEPRDLIQETLASSQLLSSLPEGYRLVVDNNNIWDQKSFYIDYSNTTNFSVSAGNRTKIYGGKGYYNLFAHEVSDLESDNQITLNNLTDTYYLRYENPDEKSSYVVFGKITNLTCSDDTIFSATGPSLQIIPYEKGTYDDDNYLVSYYTYDGGNKTFSPGYQAFKDLNFSNRVSREILGIYEDNHQIDFISADVISISDDAASIISRGDIFYVDNNVSKFAFSIDTCPSFTLNSDPYLEKKEISGWICSPNESDAIESMFFLNKNNQLSPLIYPIVRKDVGEFYNNPAMEYSGFQGTVFSQGSDQLSNTPRVLVIGKNNQIYLFTIQCS
jgi:hypothetical protein